MLQLQMPQQVLFLFLFHFSRFKQRVSVSERRSPSSIFVPTRQARMPSSRSRLRFGRRGSFPPGRRVFATELDRTSSRHDSCSFSSQLPKAGLLTFWFSSFGPFLVMGAKG